jgi:hypothetical protein
LEEAIVPGGVRGPGIMDKQAFNCSIIFIEAYAMRTAKSFPPFVPVHRAAETEVAVWMMIVILVGLMCFAVVGLLERVGG